MLLVDIYEMKPVRSPSFQIILSRLGVCLVVTFYSQESPNAAAAKGVEDEDGGGKCDVPVKRGFGAD